MWYTKEEAEKKYKGVFFGSAAYIGEGADIRAGAYIGAGADIRAGADIGERADIGEGAVIATVCSKYVGNIIPSKGRIDIRIGCEIHDVETWDKKGKALARKHHESEWWEKTGKNMLEFLKAEVINYLSSLTKDGEQKN